MAARSKGRLLAPLALLAVLVAGILVIQHASRSSSPAREKSRLATTGPGKGTGVRPRRHRPARPRTYVVQNGDFLSTIAQKTGVSVAKLQELNAGVDPQTLHAGQRLKLR